MRTTFVCRDCHKVSPILRDGGTGYATLRDGHRVCYACCAERDRRFMVRKGVNTLYLTNGANGWEVTNWPGTLRFPAFHVSKSHHRCFGSRDAQRLDAHFVGPDGHVWHAVVRGDMDLARCKRTKQLWQH